MKRYKKYFFTLLLLFISLKVCLAIPINATFPKFETTSKLVLYKIKNSDSIENKTTQKEIGDFCISLYIEDDDDCNNEKSIIKQSITTEFFSTFNTYVCFLHNAKNNKKFIPPYYNKYATLSKFIFYQSFRI